MKKVKFLFLMMLTMAGSVMGQQMEEDLFELSLEELMNIKIDVASGKGTTLRESPGIISYIDAEDIKNSGASDLMEVLRMVPGFEFATDVDQTVGVGIRGNWGFEGKVLILLDGQPMNETSFGTFTLSQRIPIENIEKIEIIRGPGSALYGGVAGLAVVSITTKSGTTLNGAEVSARYGVSEGKSVRENIVASFGKAFSDDISMSVSAYQGRGRQSAGVYEALDGRTINYGDSAMLTSTSINLGAKIKGLNTRFIYDALELPNVGEFSSVLFNGIYLGADYEIKATERLSITPRLQYKKQQPWSFQDNNTGFYNVENSRLTGFIKADWTPSDRVDVVFGAEVYKDRSAILANDYEYSFLNGENELLFTNVALFAQATFNAKIANFTAGLRYDDHSAVDAALVPRFGLTKVVNDWHFKLLYSKAFKTPVIENIHTNSDIKPERISVAEFETGYRLTNNSVLMANVFYTKINDVIVYSESSPGIYMYSNYPNSGTAGLEVDYKYKGKWGSVNASYSYYQANKNAQVDAFKIEGNDRQFLGLPGHKLAANGHFRLTKNLFLNPRVIYFSSRYFYEYDGDGELILNKKDNIVLVHLQLAYENLFTKGLGAGIALNNIGSARDMYTQPYNGGGAPVLGMGREFTVNVNYRFGQ